MATKASPAREALLAETQLLRDELLAGAPDFLDLPQEHREGLEKRVLRLERIYWMQARRVPDNEITRTLIRRAIYAEQRAYDAEMRAAELALICSGMKDEVDRLNRVLTDTAKGVRA